MKNLITISFCVLSCYAGIAQISFEDHIVRTDNITQKPRDMAFADLDGDGSIDGITASYEDNKLAWYKNIGGETMFGMQQLVSQVNGASGVAAGDLDGDGDIDLVSASANDNIIGWHENLDGLGNFAELSIIGTMAWGASEVYIDDIDGDGDMDIVAGSRFLHWYENIDGLGTFELHNIISSAVRIHSIFLADIDSDNDIDILFSYWSSDPSQDVIIAWYDNADGLGTFSEYHDLPYDIGVTDLVAADLDNDSDLDVVTTDEIGRLNVHFNLDGLGNFSAATQIASDDYLSAVSVADINGDGHGDICYARGNAYWKENDGLGNFGPRKQIAVSNSITNKLEWKDIENDGDLDLFTVNEFDDRVSWYENTDGLGDFSSRKEVSTTALIPTSIIAANIDSSCNIDILADSWFENKVYYFSNLGLDGFSEERIISDQNFGRSNIFAADMDGDLDLDVIIGSPGTGKIMWFENLSDSGDFGATKEINAFPGHANSLRIFDVGDVDGDGSLDVLFTGSGLEGDHKVTWSPNTSGSGDFEETFVITEEIKNINSINLSDLDSDGDLDVLVGASHWESPLESRLSWFENLDGLGNFGEQIVVDLSITEWAFYYKIEGLDLDGDGDNDFVVNSNEGHYIAWYENIDGLGNFSSRRIIQDERFSWKFFSADLDGDFDLDIISATGDAGGVNRRLVYYENLDGLGTYGDANTILVTDPFFPIIDVSDMDLDGDIDIVYAGYNMIGWLENLAITGTEPCIDDSDDLESLIDSLTIVYPIPSDNLITISSEFDITSLIVFTRLRQPVLQSDYSNEIDISRLSAGIYFLEIRFENGIILVRKIIKN